MNKMDKKNALFLSYIFSKQGDEYMMDAEDIKYELNPEVTDVQVPLYIDIIRMLGEGASYDEIFDYIDNYSNFEFEELLEDQKTYVKTRIKKDLNSRINRLKKEDDFNE